MTDSTAQDAESAECICPRFAKDEPRLYGISMGYKGQRISNSPTCPKHRNTPT